MGFNLNFLKRDKANRQYNEELLKSKEMVKAFVDRSFLGKPSAPARSNKEIVEEIHETFFTEVDRLLEDAKITGSMETTKQALLNKAARLTALGFSETKECQEAKAESARLGLIQLHNQHKENLIRAINYFQFKYPQYKFITEESVKKICGKYNLIYGPAERYIGTVPDKNLADMEAFAIDPADECWETIRIIRFTGNRKIIRFVSGEEMIEKARKTEIMSPSERMEQLRFEFLIDINEYTNQCKDEICAPVSDFNTTGMDIDNFNLQPMEIPDPVVLKPVFFAGMKHYLIKTAWGAEGSDELVVNQKMN